MNRTFRFIAPALLALDKFKVPAAEKNEVVGMLESLKGDVVQR